MGRIRIKEFRRVLAAAGRHAAQALAERAEKIVAVAPTPSGRIAIEWRDLVSIGCGAAAKAAGEYASDISDCICLEISRFVASREGKGPTFRPHQFQRNSPVSGASVRLMGGQPVDYGFSSQSIAEAIRTEERRGRKRKFYGSLPQEHASVAVIERTLQAYQPFVKAVAARLISKYGLPEAERDDLEQVGSLAIMGVIRRGAAELYTKNVEWRMLMYCKHEGRVARGAPEIIQDIPEKVESYYDQEPEGWQALMWLDSCMAILPPKEREIVRLIYFEEMKPVEIARELGVLPSTVSARHSSALAAMKAFLEAARIRKVTDLIGPVRPVRGLRDKDSHHLKDDDGNRTNQFWGALKR